MHIINSNDTLICPKCKSVVSFSAKYCPNCKLQFGTDGFTPIPNEKGFSNFKKLIFVVISIPPFAFVLGAVLEAIIPGCNCDDFGSNCPSCGSIGCAIHALKFGGLGFSIFSLFLTPFLSLMK